MKSEIKMNKSGQIFKRKKRKLKNNKANVLLFLYFYIKVKQINIWCTPSKSDTFSITAACAPLSVGVTRDCAANHAIVSWQALQTGSLYAAVLQDEHGLSVNCSTSSNNCTFANLLCGMNYNVTVTRNDGQCGSPPSTPIQIQSGNSKVRMHACLHSNNRPLKLTMHLL